MPIRHGNAYRVLGWLILVLLLPSVLSAQQETKEAEPPVIQGEGAAKETPPPKNKADKAPAEQKPPAAETLPPTLPVENKRPAENLIPPAYWQVGLGFLGVILIAIALFYTRKAAISAHNAAVQAARAATAGIDAVAAVRRSERAYVTMSHTPPGLDVLSRMGYATFEIKIENHGQTPATITDVLLHLDWFGEGKPAPNSPPYRIDEPRKKVGFFLVTKADFFLSGGLPIPNKGGGDELWLYGYVDYTDEFGQDHRGGYARIYSDALAGRSDEVNNLVFVDKQGWNYDCPRTPDEDSGEAE